MVISGVAFRAFQKSGCPTEKCAIHRQKKGRLSREATEEAGHPGCGFDLWRDEAGHAAVEKWLFLQKGRTSRLAMGLLGKNKT
jgi:hypothetical protein